LSAAEGDKTALIQRLHEMEANYAHLREEYYQLYYTLYPHVPPSPPNAGPARDAPGREDDGAASSSSSRYFD